MKSHLDIFNNVNSLREKDKFFSITEREFETSFNEIYGKCKFLYNLLIFFPVSGQRNVKETRQIIFQITNKVSLILL